MKQEHNIDPVWNSESQILILGSFPSVKSRDSRFFYGHPQNRFWKVVAAVKGCPVPETVEEKKEFLLSQHIAVWDVISSCDIVGSSDVSIKNAVANDIRPILEGSRIKRIFVNGKTAARLYERYIFPSCGIKATVLPSTSPANAAFDLERLCEYWYVIL